MTTIQNGLNIYPINPKINNQGKDEHGVTLPPFYSLFLNTYSVGKSQPKNSIVYLDERYNEKLGLVRCVYDPDPENVVLGNLFQVSESKEIQLRVFEKSDPIFDMNVFLIGEDGTGHYFFMVGIGKDNADQIFIESSDLTFPGGNRLTKLADNIFDFMKSFNLREIEDGIGYGVEYNQLYKNWNENFWRVRKVGEL